jgi:carboxynorspermidine decarboxylase
MNRIVLHNRTDDRFLNFTPAYIIDETASVRKPNQIRQDRAAVNIILAFKAFAMWKIFPIFIKEYRLLEFAVGGSWRWKEMGSGAHLFARFIPKKVSRYQACSSHTCFNSLAQFHRFYRYFEQSTAISCGLRQSRIFREVKRILQSRGAGFAIGHCPRRTGIQLPTQASKVCIFIRFANPRLTPWKNTLQQVETQFGDLLPHLKWLNMGRRSSDDLQGITTSNI